MSIKCYKINTDGFYIEDFIVNGYDNLTQDIIIEEIPEGLYMPRWNGETWIEGASQEYIDGVNKVLEIQPTTQEILNAKLLKENAEQKLINAELLKQIAELKGGSTNV